MKIIKRIVLATTLSIIFTVNSALAGTVNGTVSYITALAGGVYFFSINSTESGKPSCNTQGRFAVDSNSAGGRTILSIVLGAYLSGKTIGVNGTNTCDIWGDSESVVYISTP